jgi:serine protease Do
MKSIVKRPTAICAMGTTLVVAIGMLFLCSINDGHATSNASSSRINPSLLAPATELSRAFETVASQIKPAVVSVFSEKMAQHNQEEMPFPFGENFFRQFFGQEMPTPQISPHKERHEYKVPERGMGSGIIMDREGRVLTNYHVVREVDTIKVQLADKRQFDAEIVGTDPKSDVAIIKLKGKIPSDLPTATLGDSNSLKVGDWVLAVGAPFGLQQTVTAGIISATGRANVGVADYEDFIQTDAAINPGNSGGPLVDMNGEVIGMNTAIASSIGQFAGVGFAIPINMIKDFMPTLIKGDTIARGYLGVMIQDPTPELATQFHLDGTKGAIVSQVNKDSPADKAGVKVGDVVVRYQDKPTEDVRTLRNAVAATKPGTKAHLIVMRDGKEKNLSMEIGTLPSTEEASAGTGKSDKSNLDHLGLSVQPLTAELARQFGYENQHGLLVNDVEAGSPSARAGLQPGDLILEVNRQTVSSVDEMRAALGKNKESALLLVKRTDTSLFVVMQTAEK